ncbi:MAG TPA: hypothetical protein PKD90_04835 [Phnomibacter sp.]|nr:hypothetical protein [Phnomibacter sp.]
MTYFEHWEPARSFAVGGTGQVGYRYMFCPKTSGRFFGEFIMDANGYVLSALGIMVAWHF